MTMAGPGPWRNRSTMDRLGIPISAVTADKTILCVHEDSLDWPEEKLAAWYSTVVTGYGLRTSRRRWCERISIARFNLEWLKEPSAT